MVLVMTADFLAGGLVPLPFLPDWITKYIYLSPFASMQNDPFRIYSGNISVQEGILNILLQLIWAVILIIIGKLALDKALRHVVVQGS